MAGLELAPLTGLAIAKNSESELHTQSTATFWRALTRLTVLLNEKSTKESQITDLQNEISKIKATRTQLEERGQADLITFTFNIKAISGVWVHVQNDAQEIHKWLQDGADDAVSRSPYRTLFTVMMMTSARHVRTYQNT